MNSNNYFKNIYKDFFRVESSSEENNEKRTVSLEESQKEMTLLFDRINDLYLKEESKDLLKQMIEYMRKYNEGIEKNYIPYRVILTVNNKFTKDEVLDILSKASKHFNYVNENNYKVLSLYKIDKELDFNKYDFISIEDLSGLNLEDEKTQDRFIHSLDTFLSNDNSHAVISGTKEELSGFFLGRENIKNKHFNFTIEGINPSQNDIYNFVLSKVILDEKQVPELLDYISSTYGNESDYMTYQNDLIKYISFNKKIPPLNESKTLDDIFKNLNELTGLDKVKKVLYELVDVISLKDKTKGDLKIGNINLHMVFLGNPGTGKTTIARIISDILYDLKYIKENKLIEVSSKDLVAEYVGQTAPKTMSVIEKALNGVLFIDEAYTLAGKDNSYNAEAIATLIQAMENYRDKLIVIFAGYTKEMKDFLNSNPGIVSRIGYTLEFDNYTTKELITIFKSMATKNGFDVTDEALDYLRKIIDINRNTKNFGNARFVRNIYEKTVIKHASNVKNKQQKKILKTITKNDINTENLILDL